MQRNIFTLFIVLALLLAMAPTVLAAPAAKNIKVNVVLNTAITDDILADLDTYGKVKDRLYQINALTMQLDDADLQTVRDLPYVAAANPDKERYGSPVDTVSATDFSDGLSTWDQDAINVTDFGFANRQVAYDGSGVYVAVLDTGLVDTWRQYFPEERIAADLATSFGGGGGENGNVSSQPNKWEHDANSHGTHVTSTILGYSLRGTPINGVAPNATVIPVKVLNQNGSGWSSVVAQGITYVGDLKAGPLSGSPVVINMSLGGPELDAMEKAAIDYAISQGVIIVASAGNSGAAGMGYPGAYAPVISVAAAGWVNQWTSGTWWYSINVADPTAVSDFYIASFSSRELAGQDLDVAAPGSWVVGPYQLQNGKTSYFYLSGTSMSSPHVAGIAALMVQKEPGLDQVLTEAILEAAAIPMGAGCLNVFTTPGVPGTICWGADATGHGFITADAALSLVP
jgi:subtilisin family serine protease